MIPGYFITCIESYNNGWETIEKGTVEWWSRNKKPLISDCCRKSTDSEILASPQVAERFKEEIRNRIKTK